MTIWKKYGSSRRGRTRSASASSAIVTAPGTRRRITGGSDLLRFVAAEQAGRPEDEDRHEDPEHDRVLEAPDVEVERLPGPGVHRHRVLLHQADQDPPHHRARDVADPSEHGGHE